jgi:DNA-binding protein HU-beta
LEENDMNKSELIRAAAEKAGMSMKDTEAALNAAEEVMVKALSEAEKVQLVGFGSFELKSRAARTGRNPKTKEAIEIPAFRTVAFRAGKALKDAVSK